jgi:hypothetical protein
VVCIVGNLLAVVAIMPHLAQALRERRPAGSPYGWALGALCGMLSTTYGLLIGDPLVGAPGWITVPIGTSLAVWAWRYQRALTVPAAWQQSPAQGIFSVQSGDTLTFPAAREPRPAAALVTRPVRPPVPTRWRAVSVADLPSTVEMPRVVISGTPVAGASAGRRAGDTVEMPVTRLVAV